MVVLSISESDASIRKYGPIINALKTGFFISISKYEKEDFNDIVEILIPKCFLFCQDHLAMFEKVYQSFFLKKSIFNTDYRIRDPDYGCGKINFCEN